MSCVNQDMPAPVMAPVREIGEGFGDLDSIFFAVIMKNKSFGPLCIRLTSVYDII